MQQLGSKRSDRIPTPFHAQEMKKRHSINPKSISSSVLSSFAFSSPAGISSALRIDLWASQFYILNWFFFFFFSPLPLLYVRKKEEFYRALGRVDERIDIYTEP